MVLKRSRVYKLNPHSPATMNYSSPAICLLDTKLDSRKLQRVEIYSDPEMIVGRICWQSRRTGRLLLCLWTELCTLSYRWDSNRNLHRYMLLPENSASIYCSRRQKSSTRPTADGEWLPSIHERNGYWVKSSQEISHQPNRSHLEAVVA